MSALLVLLVLGPSVATLAVALVPDRAAAIGTATAAAAGLGWAVVASSTDVVVSGDLVADPLLAAAAVGLCALVAGSRSVTATGVAASLLVLTLVPGAAALDPVQLPDRRLAAGVALAGLLAAVRLLEERGPRLGQAVVVVSGLLLAAGLIGDDPGEALVLSAAGTLVAAVAAATWGRTGLLLLPTGLLVLARTTAVRPPDPDLDVALLAVAGLVGLGAAVLVLAGARPTSERLPLAAVLAAVGLLALDAPELRGAGVLLGAGGVLALAGGHPLALVALGPGLATAVHHAGLGSTAEHAAVGAAAVAVLAAGVSGRATAAGRPRRPTPLTAVAVAFAVVPVWGWAGVRTEAYAEAVAVAAAVLLPAAVVALLVSPGAARDSLVPAAGRIMRRPPADPSHGTTPHAEPSAEEAHREEAGASSP